MVDAHRPEISTGIQSTYEPIDWAEDDFGERHSLQSTKYKSEAKSRIAHNQATGEPNETDHWTENEFQQFLFQLIYNNVITLKIHISIHVN